MEKKLKAWINWKITVLLLPKLRNAPDFVNKCLIRVEKKLLNLNWSKKKNKKNHRGVEIPGFKFEERYISVININWEKSSILYIK